MFYILHHVNGYILLSDVIELNVSDSLSAFFTELYFKLIWLSS